MFGKRKFLIAFLNNSELRLVSYEISGGKVAQQEREILTLSSSAVKDSAIIDAQAFQTEVAEFFLQKKKFGNLPVLLILPEEKVFLKGFELDLGDLERKDFFRNEFISEIPFEPADLFVHERLIGRVLEFSALHRRFIEDFQAPFLNRKMEILGATSVPQIMAMDLHPKEKSFLLAFYDNDFVLALAENSSIIFSETREMKADNVMEAMRAFDHFVLHLKATETKAVSIILGEDSIEEALKDELERRGYLIKEIKKINVLDMIAGYYNLHKDEAGEWNLIRVKSSPMINLWKKYSKPALNILTGILLLAVIGGAGWWAYMKLLPSAGGPDTFPVETISKELPAPIAEEIPVVVPPQKSDFSVQIFNGTSLAGEAGRLKSVLTDMGFTVFSTGNSDEQNQVVTTIFVRSDAPDEIISDLRVILEARYAEVLVSPSPITENDIRIVIGRKKSL